MSNLENIIDIAAAIRVQKKNKKESLPNIIEDLFKRERNSDISSKVKDDKEEKKDFPSKIDKKLFVKEGKIAYSPFKMFSEFSEYISLFKNKIYGYYSNIKSKFNKAKENIGYKLLKEIEDWGTIYFKTAFSNMYRLTPQGAMARYLQELWICVSKKVK